MKKLITLGILIVVLTIPFKTVSAASASTLIEGPSSIKQDEIITLSYFVVGNENSIINASADIEYNSGDVEFISFTKASIPLWEISHFNNGTSIQVNAYATATPAPPQAEPITDKKLIGTIKFKVLATPGKTVTVSTANLRFSGPNSSISATTGSWSVTVYTPQIEASYGISVTNDGNGSAKASKTSAKKGDVITLDATPKEGYEFKEWQVVSGGVKVSGNKFTVGTTDVKIKAIFIQIPTDNPLPGNKLQELVVDGSSLYPPFDPDDPDMTDFILILPCGQTKIDISAIPAIDESIVEIIGAEELTKGSNIVQIIVIDSDGTVKEYTITVMVCEENDNIIEGKKSCWWWLLILMFVLGSTTGYGIDKYLLKKNK